MYTHVHCPCLKTIYTKDHWYLKERAHNLRNDPYKFPYVHVRLWRHSERTLKHLADDLCQCVVFIVIFLNLELKMCSKGQSLSLLVLVGVLQVLIKEGGLLVSLFSAFYFFVTWVLTFSDLSFMIWLSISCAPAVMSAVQSFNDITYSRNSCRRGNSPFLKKTRRTYSREGYFGKTTQFFLSFSCALWHPSLASMNCEGFNFFEKEGTISPSTIDTDNTI